MAGMPGIRAKRFSGGAETRRSGNVMSLPENWSFSTGGFPRLSVEIYVLSGSVTLGEFQLGPGGYAYLPDGSSGVSLATGTGGATMLYFLEDSNPSNAIQTPLITNQNLLPWSSDPEAIGVFTKELRYDPGSGARTWLMRVDPFATFGWQRRSVGEQGFLLEGDFQTSECVGGEPVAGSYGRGGYYARPAGAVFGGPGSGTDTTAVWLLRTLGDGDLENLADCEPPG